MFRAGREHLAEGPEDRVELVAHVGQERGLSEKEEEITAYEGDINNKEAAIAEYEAMIAEQQEERR